MLVMVVFFIAFRWIHLSTPLIRLFLLVLILLLMPTLNFLPVWFALSLLRFRLPSRLPRSEERFSRNAETELVCRLLLEKKTSNAPDLQMLKKTAMIFVRRWRVLAKETRPIRSQIIHRVELIGY